jgi:hypothetical protein
LEIRNALLVSTLTAVLEPLRARVNSNVKIFEKEIHL